MGEACGSQEELFLVLVYTWYQGGMSGGQEGFVTGSCSGSDTTEHRRRDGGFCRRVFVTSCPGYNLGP